MHEWVKTEMETFCPRGSDQMVIGNFVQQVLSGHDFINDEWFQKFYCKENIQF